MNNIERYFLGANSPGGFLSLYDGFVSAEAGDFLYIIKGGAGCGKSSFMKKLGKRAEEEGFDVEYIFCSGDPQSLDGVYFPQKRTAYVDGTAPHVIEPRFTAVSEAYLDLGKFYDAPALRAHAGGIMELSRSYKDSYRRAYAYLAAWGKAYDTLDSAAARETALKRAESAARRELGKGSGSGKIKKRFISAFTCEGRIVFDETVKAHCGRVYTLDNELGYAPIFLDRLTQAASAAKYDVTYCVDPLLTDRPQALLIPALSLGFLAVTGKEPWEGESARHIRLDASVDRKTLRSERSRLRTNAKLRAALLESAQASLKQAKALHDEMEKIYNPFVDFGGVYETAREHADALFS